MFIPRIRPSKSKIDCRAPPVDAFDFLWRATMAATNVPSEDSLYVLEYPIVKVPLEQLGKVRLVVG